MRWPWRRRKAKPVEPPPPLPEPDPVDDYDRDPRTKQGNPYAMRCRLCNGPKTVRLIRGADTRVLLHCPRCDTLPGRN